MRKFSTTVCVLTLLCMCAAAIATAQDADTIRAIFASAPKTATRVPGVMAFAGPPKGFNPLTASGEELARYGLPQRPDAQSEPQRYHQWARAMTALKYRATDVIPSKWHSSPAKLINRPSNAAAVSNGPTTVGSLNWSGVANSNKLTKWNANTSFNFVESAIVVPSAYTPFNACANGITGPFLMSAWNGIDGLFDGDVIQGGVLTYSDCGGAADNFYGAWVEWFPSYPSLFIGGCPGTPNLTSTTVCPVTPGDTIFVETFASPGTDAQTVFVENVSQGWGNSFELTWQTGPGVVGSSEEQIVERPCCVVVNNEEFPYALNNYDYDYIASALGTDGKGTEFYVGEQTTATYLLDMYDDAGTTLISEPVEQGSTGNAGKFLLWVSDEGCAYSGGCTP